MDIPAGFLNIRKPPDCTSYDVIRLLKKSLGIKTIGHTGTLDPFATGVLIIGLNYATRLFEYLPPDKVYIAKILFGLETDTNDITGNVVKKYVHIPSINEIKEKIKTFTGKIKQKPPVFSSIKIQGQRAYKLARNNDITLDDIKEKEVEIYSVEIVSFCDSEIELNIHSSSGTYIRSLARDIGTLLKCGAVLSSLTRVKIGEFFTYEKSIEPDKINKNNLLEYLIPPQDILNLQKVYLTKNQSEIIKQGNPAKIELNQFKINNSADVTVQFIDNKNKLIGIGMITKDCIIKPKKVFISGKQDART